MAVEIAVTGNGHFAGARSNLANYSVTEDATPIDANDSSGGVGQINFTAIEDAAADGTILLLNDVVTLTDASNGVTSGIVNNLQVNDSSAAISADSRLGLMVAQITAAPYTGTLGGAFTYYLSLCGIVSGFVIDSTITARSVTYQGFTGNLWDFMRQMCAAQQVEISLVSNNIVLRPLRTRTLMADTDNSQAYTVSNGQLAQSVIVNYYNSVRQVSTMVYPAGGWTSDVQVYQVDSGQTIEFDLDVPVSLESISQPAYVASVAKNFTGPGSVYTAAGNDGLPITPAFWKTYGGNLVASINPDNKSIHIVLTGPVFPQYAPYRIAMSSGPSDYYSALRINGTGVFFTQKSITALTGAPASKAPQVIGTTIDNIFINSVAEAWNVALRTAGGFASPIHTIDITANVVNRKGDKGSIVYPTFTNFDTTYAGKTFAQFDTLMGSNTFDQFNAIQFAAVQDNFANQAFGNIAGARRQYREAFYRVRTGTTTEQNITYTAEMDTIFSDFDNVWPFPAPVTILRTNQSANPVPVGTTGYTAATTMTNPLMSDGITPCISITTATAITPYIWSSPSTVAITAGETYVLSAMIEISGDPGGVGYTIRGHGITGNVYFSSGSTVITGNTSPTRVTIICTPNANVAANEFGLSIVRAGTQSGVTLRMGKVQIEKVDTPGSPIQFDGSIPDTSTDIYSWVGTANASASTYGTTFPTTFAAFDTKFAGKTFQDYAVIPLWA